MTQKYCQFPALAAINHTHKAMYVFALGSKTLFCNALGWRHLTLLTAITLWAGSTILVFGGESRFETCHARWSETNLVIGNAHIERTWQIRDGLLTATSFCDLDAGVEWLAKTSDHPAPAPAGKPLKENRAISISAKSGRFNPVEAESLEVEITATGRQSFNYRFQIFPAARGVAIQYQSTGGSTKTNHAAQLEKSEVPTGANEQATPHSDQADDGDALEDLLLAPQHLRLTQVTFADQTDIHNELVSEREWLLMQNERTIFVQGNVFYCENVLTGDGLIFLKQAPLPDARPIKNDWDMAVKADARQFHLAGQGYPFVVLAYRGGRNGRIETLQNYQRQVRVYDSNRDGMFLSNTWGDRSRDARINESFMEKEIAVGHRVGVDVVQIDDGWQKGRSVNSAFANGMKLKFWEADPHYWDIDPQRFPEGLDKLVTSARTNGMKFGLWYAPDSSQNFTNWQRDAERVLELWRQHGIEYFKFDMIVVSSPEAESNLHHLFDRIQNESKGKIVIDLDVTAGIRPGYFGALETGPIFVENRYTDFHRYWPHQTLRNLWQLSQYVDPLRLRMEFLNNTRNVNLYPDDPLAPAVYAPDCLFATVMVANPLGWFETSSLPDDYTEAVAQLVKTWKLERDKLHSGNIIPIGNVPDGVSWTGFASVAQDHRSGYLLLFRELNESSQWDPDLSMFSNVLNHVTVLAGDGTARMDRGKLRISIPKPLHYLWLRVENNPTETEH
jgi:alpha-galactosidase